MAFLAVARLGSATVASAHLNLAQSAITKRIASLEQEMGTALFVRDRRGMSPTLAGELFLPHAIKIEREYRDGFDEVSSIASAGLSEMKVGAGPVFSLKWVAGLFVELKSQYPDLKLDLQTLTEENPSDWLISGELDVYLGIIREGNLDETIVARSVTQVEHGIVMRASDPNSQGTTVNPARLAKYGWVSFVVDPITERSIEKYTLPKGANGSLIDIRTTSFATGVQLVKTGRFVMSAPLQLSEIVKSDGLVVLPVRNGMPRRNAGVQVRRSLLGYGAIQSVFDYFERLRV